jgi:hypothetical protein
MPANTCIAGWMQKGRLTIDGHTCFRMPTRISPRLNERPVVFARNPANGALTPAGCIGNSGNGPPSCIGTDGLDGASSVAVSPNGKNVYVGSGNALAVFNRATSGGGGGAAVAAVAVVVVAVAAAAHRSIRPWATTSSRCRRPCRRLVWPGLGCFAPG